MSVYEYIKSLSIERMARLFGELGFVCEMCAANNKFLQNGRCDEDCQKHCEQWLMSDASLLQYVDELYLI